MEDIILRKIRSKVDEKYVGFRPNGSSIKPVHVANGSFRVLYGASANTQLLKQLSYVSDAKGNTPKNNTLEKVRETLLLEDKINEDIDAKDLESMRNVMQKLLAADKGVFSGEKDGMVSYSSGSKAFITNKATYEDVGELIGSFYKDFCPELASYVKKLLEKNNDPITLLFFPVLDTDSEQDCSVKPYEDIECFLSDKFRQNAKKYFTGIIEASNCLVSNLRNHPNPLTQLRLINLFSIMVIIRYFSVLEAIYCDGKQRPFIIDFSGKSGSPMAQASTFSLTLINQSISRFYVWAIANELEEYSTEDLFDSNTPRYDENKTKKEKKSTQLELDTMWNLAKTDAKDIKEDENEVRNIFAQQIFDMLALEASSHPIKYLQFLGISAGILYPPDANHPNKRFVISQDILEMLIRSCVKPGEIITGEELREKLWNSFGIIVGGSSFESKILEETGTMLQIDQESLERNFENLVSILESMDFAERMADGILQISLGGE